MTNVGAPAQEPHEPAREVFDGNGEVTFRGRVGVFPRIAGLALAWSVPLFGTAATWALSLLEGQNGHPGGGLRLSESTAMSSLGIVATLIVAVHVASWGLTRTAATDLAVAHRLRDLGIVGYVLAAFCGLLAVSAVTTRFSWNVLTLAALVSWFGIDVARPRPTEQEAIERARTREITKSIEAARAHWAGQGAQPCPLKLLWLQAVAMGGCAGVVADLAMTVQLWDSPRSWREWALGLLVIAASGAGLLLVNAGLIIRVLVVLPSRTHSNLLARTYLAALANGGALFAVWAGVSRGDGAAAWLLLAWAAPTLAVLTQVVRPPSSMRWHSSSRVLAPVVVGRVLVGLDRERVRLQTKPQPSTRLWAIRRWLLAITGGTDPTQPGLP